MKKSIKTVLLLYLLAFFILFASALPLGPISDVLSVLAYAVPVFISYPYAARLKREREEERGLAEAGDGLFSFSVGDAAFLLPLIAPFVAVIFIAAALTSLLLNALGLSNDPGQLGAFAPMLISHALIPAVLEEMLFRYVPMKLLLPYSRKYCVLISSLVFAAFHMNLFQIPYALIAGVLFILIDILFGSIWPSFVLHLVNNVLSVVFMKYCGEVTASRIFFVCLASSAIISVAVCIILRRTYKARFLSRISPLGGVLKDLSEE